MNYAFASVGGIGRDLQISASTASLIGALFFLGYFAAQIPARIDHSLQVGRPLLSVFIDLRRFGNGVRLHHDGRFTLGLAFGITPSQRRYFLPQRFGDERNHRMREAQHRLEHAQQCAARGALLVRLTRLDLNLGEFEIPVTVFVPYELV